MGSGAGAGVGVGSGVRDASAAICSGIGPQTLTPSSGWPPSSAGRGGAATSPWHNAATCVMSIHMCICMHSMRICMCKCMCGFGQTSASGVCGSKTAPGSLCAVRTRRSGPCGDTARRSGAATAVVPFSTRWAHCEGVVRGCEHGDHQAEGAVAWEVKGGEIGGIGAALVASSSTRGRGRAPSGPVVSLGAASQPELSGAP